MENDKIQQTFTCEHCGFLMHPDFDGENITYSCLFGCQAVRSYLSDCPDEVTPEDIEFLKYIGIYLFILDDSYAVPTTLTQ